MSTNIGLLQHFVRADKWKEHTQQNSVCPFYWSKYKERNHTACTTKYLNTDIPSRKQASASGITNSLIFVFAFWMASVIVVLKRQKRTKPLFNVVFLTGDSFCIGNSWNNRHVVCAQTHWQSRSSHVSITNQIQQYFQPRANMSDAYIYDKIDEGIKSFPWNFPEKYSLPEFLPSPSNFVDGWVGRCNFLNALLNLKLRQLPQAGYLDFCCTYPCIKTCEMLFFWWTFYRLERNDKKKWTTAKTVISWII